MKPIRVWISRADDPDRPVSIWRYEPTKTSFGWVDRHNFIGLKPGQVLAFDLRPVRGAKK